MPEGLKTPVFRIIMILTALSEGMGVNAVTRVFSVGKNSIYRWLNRLSCFTANLDAVFIVSSVYSIILYTVLI
jgi:transposase-like protein